MKYIAMLVIALRILGVILLVSCLSKAYAPSRTVAWLASTRLGIQMSYLLVLAIAFGEGTVAALLLVIPRSRGGHIAAFVLFSVLLGGRGWAYLEGANGSCGCFGSVAVPALLSDNPTFPTATTTLTHLARI